MCTNRYIMRKIYSIIAISIFLNVAAIAQKATLDGEYASRSLSLTNKDKVYFEGFRFVNATDSFYYWHYEEEEGKGTFKIVDNKLYLNFEDDHIKKQPVKNYELIPGHGDGESKTIIFRFIKAQSGKYLRGGMVQIVTASGNKLVKAEVQDSVALTFSKADFPLQAKAHYLNFKMVPLTIDTAGSYNVDLLFQPKEAKKLTSGEVRIFEMGKITDTAVELKTKSDLSFFQYKKIQ